MKLNETRTRNELTNIASNLEKERYYVKFKHLESVYHRSYKKGQPEFFNNLININLINIKILAIQDKYDIQIYFSVINLINVIFLYKIISMQYHFTGKYCSVIFSSVIIILIASIILFSFHLENIVH